MKKKNPNNINTKSCNWYLTANLLLLKDGDIFKVTLTNKKFNNEKYFILSKDLKDNSLTQLEVDI